MSSCHTRLIEGDFARLLRSPAIRSAAPVRDADTVLNTQEAADLVGVSRPHIVARIEADDIPLHQQVGNQRRVLSPPSKLGVVANRPDADTRSDSLAQNSTPFSHADPGDPCCCNADTLFGTTTRSVSIHLAYSGLRKAFHLRACISRQCTKCPRNPAAARYVATPKVG